MHNLDIFGAIFDGNQYKQWFIIWPKISELYCPALHVHDVDAQEVLLILHKMVGFPLAC